MIQLNLTKEEEETLIYLLENCISDLRMEIAGTDNVSYKQMLKHRKAVLEKILATLQQSETVSTGD